MNRLKKVTLSVYGLAFTMKVLFAMDVIESEHKVKIVVASELVFWIALILDSIYNIK